jgi:hypothetical protein
MIVRVTKTEFETEDERVIPHSVPLDDVPTVEEFQAIYDRWYGVFRDKGLLEEEDGEAGNTTIGG